MIEPSSVQLESAALPKAAVEIHELRGVEELGKLFHFRIDLVCESAYGLDEDKLLSAPAALIFSRDGREDRRLFGIISAVKDTLHTESALLTYTLDFVPRAFCMSLNRMSQVFVDKSIPEILVQKVVEAGFDAGKDFDLRLFSTYPKRDLVVQYEETDLQFISRLSEHLGIAMSFDHRDGRDVLVFSDDNSAFQPIDGNELVGFYRRGDAIGVFAFEGTTRALPERYILKDYNYRTPHVELLAKTVVSDAGRGSVIEYGAHFKTQDEGDHMAKVRAEELRATRRVFDGKSDIQTLRSGGKFKLAGHPKHTEELLLIEVRHHASQAAFGSGTGMERTYTNEFRAIPAATPFRPARTTPKPKVHGAISGVIEAAQPGKYAELDDQGRYHVRLMLDHGDAPKGRASSLLRMAQPHAGPGYGFHFPLRDGVEVLLTCIDGDPDRLIITGAVPTPTTPSTVGASNGKRNVIRTGGGTEMNIDDNEGATRFKITTPCHNTIFQLGAPNAPVAGILLGTDKDTELRAGETMRLDAGERVDVIAGINLNESAPWIDIGGGSKINAHAPEVEVHGGAKVTVDGPTIDVVASGNLNEKAPCIDVEGGSKVRIGAPAVEVNGGATLKANAPLVEIGASAILTASSQALVIVNAGGMVTISSDGLVVVKAPTVNVEGSGTVNVKAGKINLN